MAPTSLAPALIAFCPSAVFRIWRIDQRTLASTAVVSCSCSWSLSLRVLARCSRPGFEREIDVHVEPICAPMPPLLRRTPHDRARQRGACADALLHIGTTHHLGRDHVPGDAYDEQLAKVSVK